jgi:hypothetical protein
MSAAAPLQAASAKPQAALASAARGVLQRKCACGSSKSSSEGRDDEFPSPLLQRKLAIGATSDPLEREADRVADQVLAAPANPAVSGAPPYIQRLARQATGQTETAPASVDRVLASPGSPLGPALRQDMEQRFGHDFSRVRVHADAAAQTSARDVDAQAYTVGRDVVFGSGQYAPGTAAGRHLIAHELTHVVQQTGPSGEPSAGSAQTLHRYRSKGKDTIAFEGADETLKDAKTQPWVEHIDIHFDKAVVDDGHKAAAAATSQLEPRMPTGTLKAKYSTASSSVPADIVMPIAGGSTMLGVGLTDSVKKSKVSRLEGLGYTDSENVRLGNLTDPVAKKGKGARYSASGAGTMNYAIFFKGIQAIHEGLLNTGSHACVHVGTQSLIRTLNHHTRIGVTTVSVSYGGAVLSDLCCHRKNTGSTSWNTNPCGSTKCP